MKPRHAAALALVGWYLMAGPFGTKRHEGAFPEPPLSEWRIIQVFDSRDSCRKKLAKDKPATVIEGGPDDLQCVAASDPRLKGN